MNLDYVVIDNIIKNSTGTSEMNIKSPNECIFMS